MGWWGNSFYMKTLYIRTYFYPTFHWHEIHHQGCYAENILDSETSEVRHCNLANMIQESSGAWYHIRGNFHQFHHLLSLANKCRIGTFTAFAKSIHTKVTGLDNILVR